MRWDLNRRRLYLCTPDRPDLARFVDACIAGGVDIVQLREKHLAERELVATAMVVQQVCAHHGVPFILNDRPDLAGAIGADGVHVGQQDTSPDRARLTVGAEAIVGLSTHAPNELATALGAGSPSSSPEASAAPVDYISAGPVVATPTKPGRAGTGLGYVREAVERSPWPVWVTGGADPTTVGQMIAAGARHIVVVRWLTEASDPRRHARTIRDAVERAIDEIEAASTEAR